MGIDLDAVTQQLEDEGIQNFVKAFDVLMNTLKKKQGMAPSEPRIGGHLLQKKSEKPGRKETVK